MPKEIMKEAKQGYGGAKIKYINPFLPFFKVIYYKKGKYKVIDSYSGDENFIGQTIYFLNQKPEYGLNYYGLVLDKKLKTREVYAFLKKALITGKSKYRGKNGFKDNGWLYRNTFNEKRGFVEGKEKIYYGKKLVYMLLYHGGKIKERKSLKEFNENLLLLEEKIFY